MQIRKNKMILRSACHLLIPIVSTDERKRKTGRTGAYRRRKKTWKRI
jgi:hypothetical protein